MWDKGKAAVIGVESELVDDDGPVATTYASLFAKGYGGFGGERGPDTSMVHQPPDREPDHLIDDIVRPEQAATYRLSGDRVLLHIDPEFARKAGYPAHSYTVCARTDSPVGRCCGLFAGTTPSASYR